MKKRTIVTTAAAATLAATLVIGGTFAYLTDSTEVATNTFAENGNSVDLDETTGSDYEIVPGTEQEKDPTITATYTLDSYVYVQVTDETEGLVEWYIANGWSELDSYDDVYVMELKTIYDAGVSEWTLVEDEESDYNGQYTYTDENGVVYYYNAGTGEYTAIIPVLDGNKVSYSADLTNEDMTVGESVNLSFQAYIMQAAGFDSAEDAYYEINVTRTTANTWSMVTKAIESNDDVEITLTGTLSTSGTHTFSGGNVTIDMGSYGMINNTYLVWTEGSLTLKGTSEIGTAKNSLWTTGSDKVLLTAQGENAEITIDGGSYYYQKYYGTIVKATDGAVINVNGGAYKFNKTSPTKAGRIFFADDATIYVNDVDEIDAVSDTTTSLSGSQNLSIFSVSGDGVIYVSQEVYEELQTAYEGAVKVSVVEDGCTAVLDTETGYYVITAN